MADLTQRIGYTGSTRELVARVCQEYQLGDLLGYRALETGYEDFNMVVQATSGKYHVKVFASFRDTDNCRRYLDIMAAAINAGVHHPKLYASGQGTLHTMELHGATLRLCVLQYIDDDTLYAMKAEISERDTRELAHEAARINSITLQPAFVYDSWAIVNFLGEFEKKKQYLDPQDLALITAVAEQFRNVNLDTLPHCFTHGDMLKTNLIRDVNGTMWVLDFSVANYAPRIIETAVLACDTLFDAKSQKRSDRMLSTFLDEYQKSITLTPEELAVLHLFIKAGHAMHVLCATYEEKANGNATTENEYWIAQGRAGLRQ
jgi:Ser/Thr protein kinase RdoA (MazF antagonist)